MTVYVLELIGLGTLILHACGLAAAAHALLYSRTPQGAIAWAILLVMFPYVVLPAYLIFGRGKFQGYVRARRAGDSQASVCQGRNHDVVRSRIARQANERAGHGHRDVPGRHDPAIFQVFQRVPTVERFEVHFCKSLLEFELPR